MNNSYNIAYNKDNVFEGTNKKENYDLYNISMFFSSSITNICVGTKYIYIFLVAYTHVFETLNLSRFEINISN